MYSMWGFIYGAALHYWRDLKKAIPAARATFNAASDNIILLLSSLASPKAHGWPSVGVAQTIHAIFSLE